MEDFDMRLWLTGLAALMLAACSGLANEAESEQMASRDFESLSDFTDALEQTFKSKPLEYSRAIALIKDGAAGPDWLATFHGLPDNKSACEEIIQPYNEDPALSVVPGRYRCIEIDSGFSLAATADM
ncbi:hypothetical protein ELI_12680 [Erythrobacter litoralis HTCC2594]|uniref:Lipoprotein n=2 Tax=Erythrobacter litoralis TaxID=39960 RepID=Q2N6R3_ERYLH|nr:hypothetical protein ELI_12680 [Erythrobacter litoralis HTCC2594]